MATSLLRVQTALERIGQAVRPLPECMLAPERAMGLTLAAAVRSDIDDPPFDRAAMDGFAVRAEDCRSGTASLLIRGEVAAGGLSARPVAAGETMRINTGAPMPPGADAVAMIEKSLISPDGTRVTIQDLPRPGQHVAPRGSSVRAGDGVLPSGTRVGPAQVSALAAAGAATISVYRRPRLAVLVSGAELVEASARPSGGQIRNSNGPCLRMLAAQAGCEVIDLGVAGDQQKELSARILSGLAVADVLCVTGGMSMGQHDFVPGALEAAGVRFAFQKVAIKPGKPVGFGVGPEGQLAFGLPGNPVSCFVCFWVFIRAALAGLQGRPVAAPPTVEASLSENMPRVGDRDEYRPALLMAQASGGWLVRMTAWQGSGDAFGLARANALVVRAAHAPEAPAGSVVSAIPLEWTG